MQAEDVGIEERLGGEGLLNDCVGDAEEKDGGPAAAGAAGELADVIGRATRDAPGKHSARFTNLIAQPDASDEAVRDVINDTLKAIAASLLMEQVLAPRYNFTPKAAGPQEGFDYGEGGYDETKTNVGFNDKSGEYHVEVKGLAMPQSPEASRICANDINDLIATFVQDKTTVARGLFDDNIAPQELTQVRMGAIVRDRFPDLSAQDQEAVRQHAIVALNLTQQGKAAVAKIQEDEKAPANTALLDGVRKYAMDVRELDVDMIDKINPFGEAYAIMAKTMNATALKQLADIIAARKIPLTLEEARDLAKRALQFKNERGRLPELTAQDPWEQRMAAGIAFLRRMKAEAARA